MWVRRDFWRSSGPAPCSKQLQQEHDAQGCVQLSFEYLQICRFYSLCRKHVLVLDHPHGLKEKRGGERNSLY